jgi:hypothetical protein
MKFKVGDIVSIDEHILRIIGVQETPTERRYSELLNSFGRML